MCIALDARVGLERLVLRSAFACEDDSFLLPDIEAKLGAKAGLHSSRKMSHVG